MIATTRRRGWRWAAAGVRVISSPGETSAAAGEVVWSWRRDPGATLVGFPAGYGGKKGRFPGESAYKPSNHCAGKAGMSRLYLSNPCAFFSTHCTRVLRVPPAPGFPCALYSREGQRDAELGRRTRREKESTCLSTSLRGAKRRPVYACCASYAGLGVREAWRAKAEAIQSRARDSGLLRFARNDG